MTMEFVVSDKAGLGKLKPGDAVEFDFGGQPDKDGDYVISRIGVRPQSAKLGSDPKAGK